MENEEEYCVCHKPYEESFEATLHDCLDYMECSECPYYYPYDDDYEWDY